MNITPNRQFRHAIEDAMYLHLEDEVKDYLNRLWLDDPNRESWSTEDYEQTLMEFVENHFTIQWLYND